MAESTSPRATFFDTKESYEATLKGIFSGRPEDIDAYVDNICAPTFHLTAAFVAIDLDGFKKQAAWMRANTQSFDLKVVQFLRDGNLRAGRHESTMTMLDGTEAKAEGFLFLEVADDGRLACANESVVRFDKNAAKQEEAAPPS